MKREGEELCDWAGDSENDCVRDSVKDNVLMDYF